MVSRALSLILLSALAVPVPAQTQTTPAAPQATKPRYPPPPTRDPHTATGGSFGAACALIMAWYHNDLYHHVLAYSGTWINQQWPSNPETPHGDWEFPEHLIPNSPRKPIRIWMEVGDFDLLNPNVMRDNMQRPDPVTGWTGSGLLFTARGKNLADEDDG